MRLSGWPSEQNQPSPEPRRRRSPLVQVRRHTLDRPPLPVGTSTHSSCKACLLQVRRCHRQREVEGPHPELPARRPDPRKHQVAPRTAAANTPHTRSPPPSKEIHSSVLWRARQQILQDRSAPDLTMRPPVRRTRVNADYPMMTTEVHQNATAANTAEPSQLCPFLPARLLPRRHTLAATPTPPPPHDPPAPREQV
jgi:hypothetical protein